MAQGGHTSLGHSSELWTLNPDTAGDGAAASWAKVQPSSSRPLPSLFGAVALPLPSLGGGRGFLVFGGSVAYGLASDKAYHYDEDVNCWAEVAVDSGGAGSPSARFQLAGMSSGETAVTVVGGRDFGEDLSDLWRCDVQLA